MSKSVRFILLPVDSVDDLVIGVGDGKRISHKSETLLSL